MVCWDHEKVKTWSLAPAIFWQRNTSGGRKRLREKNRRNSLIVSLSRMTFITESSRTLRRQQRQEYPLIFLQQLHSPAPGRKSPSPLIDEPLLDYSDWLLNFSSHTRVTSTVRKFVFEKMLRENGALPVRRLPSLWREWTGFQFAMLLLVVRLRL